MTPKNHASLLCTLCGPSFWTQYAYRRFFRVTLKIKHTTIWDIIFMSLSTAEYRNFYSYNLSVKPCIKLIASPHDQIQS